MAVLILKVTERCNSNCYYCDVVRKGSGTDMSLEMLETVFRRIGEYLAADGQRTMEVVWHGGEPLLLGPDYYRAAWEFQGRHCAGAVPRIRHNIQTNLTCFHEGFVEPLRQLGMTSVGSSFDPEPHVRGPGADRDTALYNRRFMEAVKVLERHGMGWGVIYVVTRRSLRDPMGVFTYLTNLVPTGGINFNPVLIYDQERRDMAVTPEEYADFLGAIFPTWWAHRERYPSVTPFHELVSTIIERKPVLFCTDSGQCAYNWFELSPGGRASQCGRSSDYDMLLYGNIRDRTIEQIMADGQRAQLAGRVEHVRQGECQGCRFWEICHGGCPLDAWMRHGDFLHKSEWCEARRGFIEKYFEPVTGVRFEPSVA